MSENKGPRREEAQGHQTPGRRRDLNRDPLAWGRQRGWGCSALGTQESGYGERPHPSARIGPRGAEGDAAAWETKERWSLAPFAFCWEGKQQGGCHGHAHPWGKHVLGPAVRPGGSRACWVQDRPGDPHGEEGHNESQVRCGGDKSANALCSRRATRRRMTCDGKGRWRRRGYSKQC